MSRIFWAFALFAPLPAIWLGAWLARVHGHSWNVYLPNLVAVVLGTATVVALARTRTLPRANVPSLLATFAMLTTLVSPGIQGVHRWISVASVRLHVSSIALPWIWSEGHSSRHTTRWIPWAALVATQLVHVAQPDAGQATVCALGAIPLVASSTLPRAARWMVVAVLGALACLAWTRHDPLAPVDVVERVLVNAHQRGFVWVFFSVVSLLVLVVVLFAVQPSGDSFALATTLGWSVVVSVLVTLFGNFPVPVLGAGGGPVLGWYVSFGVLRMSRLHCHIDGATTTSSC